MRVLKCIATTVNRRAVAKVVMVRRIRKGVDLRDEMLVKV